MTIRHVVAWTLAAEDPETRAEHAAEVARRLQSLADVVPSVRSLSAGPNLAYPDVNGHVAIVADFDDLDGLEAYQVHPAHLEVVTYVRSVVASRIAVDFEV